MSVMQDPIADEQVPDLETERLVLRAPTPDDLGDWVSQIWGDPEAMRYMPGRDEEPEAFAAGVLDFFVEVRQQRQLGAWAITLKSDGRFMGHAMLAYREAFGEPELGYALGKEFWGAGYGTEAARAVAAYGFEQADVPRIFGVVFPENEPSWRILRHLGFEYERDVTHYGFELAYYALTRQAFINS